MPLIKKKKISNMELEIKEQPQIVQKIYDVYVNGEEINIEIPKNINRILIVASGSSYHCARYAAVLFGSIAKIEAHAIYSSEFLLEETIAHQEDVLYIFITQSGETTDTNSALEKAKAFGVKTLCITNKENSKIWNASDYKIICHAGEEKSIAATKSFTAQLFCSALLALKFAQDKGIDVYKELLDLKSVSSYLETVFSLHRKIKQLARFLSKYKNLIVTADGSSYALAKECSLKIKETSYLNTTSAILGEFMHGHVAVLNNKKSALIYVLNGNMSYTNIKNLSSIKENYNPPIFVIGNTSSQVKSTYNLNIDCDSPIVKTFCIVEIIQLLALETALYMRKNVDKPKGLNKVVI